MSITPADLAGIDTFEQLAVLFHDKLEWPRADWPTFAGVAPLYGIKPEDVPGVQSLKAVQKLDDAQDWGIFLVDFGDNPLKTGELRNILNKVAERARQTHAAPVWPHENLLFLIRQGS